MKIVIATPVRGSGLTAPVSIGYAESVRMLARRLPIDCIPATLTFGCDVVRARNRVADHILREYPDHTHTLWWDDDLWPEDVDIIQRMVDTGEDLIAAPYTNKFPPIRWIHQYIPVEDQTLDSRKLLQVKGVGMGLTLMSRNCLERTSKAARKYRDFPSHNKVANVFGMLFDQHEGEDLLMSEDFSFCKRWRDLGGKVWIYGGENNVLHHAGRKDWSAADMEGGLK